jgi:hypothetical protein
MHEFHATRLMLATAAAAITTFFVKPGMSLSGRFFPYTAESGSSFVPVTNGKLPAEPRTT